MLLIRDIEVVYDVDDSEYVSVTHFGSVDELLEWVIAMDGWMGRTLRWSGERGPRLVARLVCWLVGCRSS